MQIIFRIAGKDIDNLETTGIDFVFGVLPIVTERHSGTMEVDSMSGKWTRFIIQLPIEETKC